LRDLEGKLNDHSRISYTLTTTLKDSSLALTSIVQLSHDYPSYATVSLDDNIRIYVENKLTKTINTNGVFCLAQQGQNILAYGGHDKTLKFWINGKITSLKGHTGVVNCLLTLRSGVLVSGSTDGTIKLWFAGKCMTTLVGHKHSISSLIQLQDDTIVSSSDDGTIRLWDEDTGIKKVLHGNDSIYATCMAELDSNYLIMGTKDKYITSYDLSGEKATFRQMLMVNTEINCIAVRDKNMFITGSSDWRIRIWINFECIQILEGHNGSVNGLIFLKDHTIVSASNDKCLKVWTIL
jgi:WD40 repeat protein